MDPAQPAKFEGMRGPKAPYRSCPTCGATSAEPFPNPLLERAKALGFYDGETTGVSMLCDHCERTDRCPTCQDTGWEELIERNRVTGEDEARARRCACSARSRTVQGLPMGYADATLQAFTAGAGREDAIESAQRWVRGDATDLYVRGGVGVGKTYLMSALLNEIVSKQSAAFVRVPDLLDRMRLLIGGDASADEEATYLDSYRRVDVLRLDDVGADKGSEYARRTLQSLYEARLDRGRRTIWTSNLSLPQLAEFFDDERLSSRIAGNADVVHMEGTDRRVGAA